MKKVGLFLFYIVISILFVACSKEDEPVPQDYTSVVFVHNVEAQTLRDCSVGYFADGVYNKIADLGDMAAGRYTQEIELADDGITEICLFVNYSFPLTFTVREDTKNVLEVVEGDMAEMLSQGTDVHILKKGYGLEKGRYQTGIL